jgi:hypothetical protein
LGVVAAHPSIIETSGALLTFTDGGIFHRTKNESGAVSVTSM